MAEYRNRNRILYPLGVTQEENGVHILVQGRAGEVRLLLYRPGEKKPCEEIPFDPKYRMGDVWELALDRTDFASFEYNFMIDGKIVTDPNARVITGREKWADRKRAGKPVRGRVLLEEFDWEDDVNRKRPMPTRSSISFMSGALQPTRHQAYLPGERMPVSLRRFHI